MKAYMEKRFILEAIAKEIEAGVFVLDSSWRFLYANPSFLEHFPIRGRIEGKSAKKTLAGTTLLSTVALLSAGPGRMKAHETEINEKGRFFKVRMTPLKEKRDFSLLVFLHDITEEKRVETIKKDFVANVSHELRTPLASIKGYSETLLDGSLEDVETGKGFLRIIDRHATRMSRLIDDLLILSKLESHQMTIESAPVDLSDIITSTVKGFEKQALNKGLRLSASAQEGLPAVLGDRDRLEQVVVNLLDNAIKYTPPGGSVVISAARAGQSVRVDVSDTGIGIPPEDLGRIFERFYRVDKARSRELGGTGLGLAIVKHIIQVHNGRLHVQSVPGKGSKFSFLLKSAG